MQNRRDGRVVRDHTVTTGPSLAVQRMRPLEPDFSEERILALSLASFCEQPWKRQIALGFSSHSTSAHLAA